MSCRVVSKPERLVNGRAEGGGGGWIKQNRTTINIESFKIPPDDGIFTVLKLLG